MTKLNQIHGLHHVTSLAASAAENNSFFTRTLGLRVGGFGYSTDVVALETAIWKNVHGSSAERTKSG